MFYAARCLDSDCAYRSYGPLGDIKRGMVMTKAQVGANLGALLATTAAASFCVAVLRYPGGFAPDPVGTALGATAGTMIWLVLVPGTLPVIWWATRRFRSESANGPLLLWWALLVIMSALSLVGTARSGGEEVAQANQ